MLWSLFFAKNERRVVEPKALEARRTTAFTDSGGGGRTDGGDAARGTPWTATRMPKREREGFTKEALV